MSEHVPEAEPGRYLVKEAPTGGRYEDFYRKFRKEGLDHKAAYKASLAARKEWEADLLTDFPPEIFDAVTDEEARATWTDEMRDSDEPPPTGGFDMDDAHHWTVFDALAIEHEKVKKE